HLTCCPSCGLIYNKEYDPLACHYNEEYEESQSHSQVFTAFHYELADYLINKYDLREKNILEIGCGKGDFLNLICSRGNNNGTGYDPAYVAGRSLIERSEKVTIFNREFPTDTVKVPVDFIICKMTLEHIPMTADFLKRIRKSIDPDKRTKVFFQVPDAKPILEQSRFWDIYYEHCSYFTNDSLARIFRICGFNVLYLSTGYDEQYLLLEAEPSASGLTVAEKTSTHQEMKLTNNFGYSTRNLITAWKNQLKEWREQKKRVALWGGGSKAVSFLTTLEINDEIQAVVDINPHKEGTFLPGTAHKIIAPADLKRIQPEIIVIMNPIYNKEINTLIKELKVNALTIPVTQHEVQQNVKLM
ncbi:MAG: class I SAM-dependent methyltransferase, partial [Desulfobulbaceae bacterium]|nr:class I SAM-dependent methyltransferase [Desulfobulbaceae bacterium]